MPSPFPGMNPFLEQEEAWHDFHESYMPALRDALNAQVGEEYVVKLDEHVYVQDPENGSETAFGRADLEVAHQPLPEPVDPGPGGLTLPVRVHVPIGETPRECFVEIRDRRTRKVVTVLELLSPANKKGGRDRI